MNTQTFAPIDLTPFAVELAQSTTTAELITAINGIEETTADARRMQARYICFAIGDKLDGVQIKKPVEQKQLADKLDLDKATVNRMVKAYRILSKRRLLDNADIKFSEEKIDLADKLAGDDNSKFVDYLTATDDKGRAKWSKDKLRKRVAAKKADGKGDTSKQTDAVDLTNVLVWQDAVYDVEDTPEAKKALADFIAKFCKLVEE